MTMVAIAGSAKSSDQQAEPTDCSDHQAELSDGPDELTESAAEISTAAIALVRQFNGIRSKVSASVEHEHWPLILLVKLAAHGPSRASDLADYMCADPSTVSRQVAALVKAGMIQRQADPHDGRASILVPTVLGQEQVQEYTRRRGSIMRVVVADWPQHDRDELQRLLWKYTEGIEAHREHIISATLEHHRKETS